MMASLSGASTGAQDAIEDGDMVTMVDSDGEHTLPYYNIACRPRIHRQEKTVVRNPPDSAIRQWTGMPRVGRGCCGACMDASKALGEIGT
jgi:hypothetical protein